MQYKGKLPQPSSEKIEHSTKLKKKIVNLIEQNGAIPFSKFMQLALYDNEFGYYRSGLQTFGSGGDFITAPEISSLFSYCIAKHFIQIKLNNASILEFGAGSGKMASDILSYLKRHNSLPEKYYIIEVSAALRQRQYTTIKQHHPELIDKVIWLQQLPEENNFIGMIVANEILDAMPVEIFRRNNANNEIAHVDLDSAKQFKINWHPANSALNNAINKLNIPEDDYQSELNPSINGWITSLAKILQQGQIILIDYGYEHSAYYHPQRSRGTLMCHFQHHAHENPLLYPGIQDITAHVDFTAVIDAAQNAGLEIINFSNQANFLIQQGITTMLAEADSKEYINQAQQLKQLLMPDMMGEKFKVLSLGTKI